MEIKKTFSIVFLATENISAKLIMNLFASLPEEVKPVLAKRDLFYATDKLSHLEYYLISLLYNFLGNLMLFVQFLPKTVYLTVNM